MKKVVIGIGMPGAGKTTALKAFALRHGHAYLCPDDIRREVTGDAVDQSKNAEVFDIAHKRLADLLRRGETVVFDATFTNPDERRAFLQFARERGAEKIEGVFFNTSFEVARERNAMRGRMVPGHAMARIERMLAESPPSLTDGLDALFVLDAEHNLVKAEIARDGREIVTREFKKFR